MQIKDHLQTISWLNFSFINLKKISLVLFQITENQVEFFTALSLYLFATLRLLPSFTSVISSLNYLKIYEPGLVTLYNENNQSFKLNHIPNKDFSKFCNKKTVSKKLIIVEKLNFTKKIPKKSIWRKL